MANNYEILPLFPIPLFKAKLPSYLSSLVPWLNIQPMSPSHPNNNFYGERSKNTYILESDKCIELKNIILDYALTYGKMLGLKCDEYKFSQSWITLKKPNQSHQQHSHSNSTISGVLYYDSYYSSPNSSIIFHKENSIDPTQLSIDYDTPLNQYNIQTVSIQPSPGDLLLFPSTLSHSVPKNTSDRARKSLAFNIVPTKGFGEESSLNKLKFN